MNQLCVFAKLLQSCLTLCDPKAYSLPGSPVVRFSRQKYWSGLPCPPSGDLHNPGIEPTSLTSPALARGFFTTSTIWEALKSAICICICPPSCASFPPTIPPLEVIKAHLAGLPVSYSSFSLAINFMHGSGYVSVTVSICPVLFFFAMK